MARKPTVYHYPGCSTCKKALRWLEARGVAYDAVHLVESTPSADTLRDLHARSGLPLRKFFNTAGRSWREGNFAERLPGLGEDQALAALAADGMLIKRPILDTGARVLVGFREADWDAALAS